MTRFILGLILSGWLGVAQAAPAFVGTACCQCAKNRRSEPVCMQPVRTLAACIAACADENSAVVRFTQRPCPSCPATKAVKK
jgi:hypothetical protein